MSGLFLPFSQREYQRRLAKTRAAMVARDIELVFLEDPSNMAWLTGYDGWSFYAHQGVVISLDRDPVWWGRAQDANGARRTVWMDDDCVLGYPDHFVQSTVCHPMQNLAAWLDAQGWGSARLGLELDNYYFSAKAYLTLNHELPNATLVDATGLVNWQRAQKSTEELVFMERAARIAERVIDGIIERIEPGMRKHELVAEIMRDAILGTDEAWGDYASIVPLLPSGPDAAAPHLTWDDRSLAVGQATFFEIAGCYRRYHAPFCRTVFLGQPPEQIIAAEQALVEGLEAGLDVARAGRTAGDIYRALAAPLARAGIERGARAGYAIGLSYPPDWGERTISIRDEDETVLEPGMTLHFMPGLWMDAQAGADRSTAWGLEITEPIVIETSGPARCLCSRKRQLFVKN